VRELMYLTVCPLRGLGSIPGCGGGVLNLATHPEPAERKMALFPLNGTTRPVEIKEEDQ